MGQELEKSNVCTIPVEKKPKFETAKGVFRVTLPNYNEHAVVQKVAQWQVDLPNVQMLLEKQKEMIVAYALENGQVTRKEVEDLLEVGSTKAFRLLKELCDAGKLKAEGREN